MAQLSIDIANPGRDLTFRAAENITQGQLLAIGGDYDQGLPVAKVAEPGQAICGAAKHNADEDTLVAVARGNARVVTVPATGPITAGQQIEVGADGTATAHDQGQIIGYAMCAATDDTVHISFV